VFSAQRLHSTWGAARWRNGRPPYWLGSAETLIIARTDARQTDGFDGAMERAAAYANGGADIVFVEALESEDEMRHACARIKMPMMANMADGGRTPIRSKAELAAIGYQLAIFPATTGLASAHAAEGGPDRPERKGTSASANLPLFPFHEFNSLIGFEDVWAFERKWSAQ
jgi:2-methylisocitrate lyase-like PEP mutase family enzyme